MKLNFKLFPEKESPNSVLLIYTGGTIGMKEDPADGTLKPFDFSGILEEVPELRKFAVKIDSYTFSPLIDSSDVEPALWQSLARLIRDRYDDYDGFVVLHGTDTMAYSASVLSFMLENLGKPVIFTGSQLPIGKLRTDGKENLITSIEIAAAAHSDGTPRVPEVCVYFHEKLMRGNRVTKSSADEFDAFESFNCPHLATAGVDITYNENEILRRAPGLFRPHYTMDTHLLIFSLFPGIRPEIVKEMLSTPTLKGVIFRTFGSGNAPQQPWLSELLAEATREGKVIVNITQCTGGCVAMKRYETGLQLLEAGVVSGHDSTVEAALTKLMFLFGKDLSPAEVRRQMALSLAGEITL